MGGGKVEKHVLPAYRVVANALRHDAANAADEGSRLPTDAELCATYGVSRQTVRAAYRELVAEGVVHRVRGRGTFACSGAKYVRPFGTIDDLMALSKDTEIEVVKPLALSAGSPRARADFGAGQVMEAWVLRLRADEPFALTVISLPLELGRRLTRTFLATKGARRRTTVIGMIESRYGRLINNAVQEITVDVPDDAVARSIGLAPGSPVLRIDRTYRDDRGDPIESTTNYFNPRRYSYRLHLGRATPPVPDEGAI